MTVITRFAPSPTGYLHIGGARTALFNYLFAKANNGKFLLRIEDTDKVRSTDDAINAILEGLKWLDIAYDGEVVLQSKRAARHAEAALSLIEQGRAYYCFTRQSDIDAKRQHAIDNKQHFIFKSPWRDKDSSQHPTDIKPVVRLKAPREGSTTIHDKLQGKVVVENDHLDDMVLLRSDGTPTYMLAVVVDDHDMGITHIIRGDDHLTNAARQILIYQAFGWDIPIMVHIPLIHGPDGAKLSKRHGALGVEAYKEMGYLPDALCNYLLRLGWAHGDDEIISRAQAIEWFDLKGLGKSPSRLDFAKMRHINAHYLRIEDSEILAKLVITSLEKEKAISPKSKENIKLAMDSLKPRTELLNDLTKLARIYIVDHPIHVTAEAVEIINKSNWELINQVIQAISELEAFSKEAIQESFKNIASINNIKLGELMLPIRALVTGITSSPSVFEIIEIIGKDETINRLSKKS